MFRFYPGVLKNKGENSRFLSLSLSLTHSLKLPVVVAVTQPATQLKKKELRIESRVRKCRPTHLILVPLHSFLSFRSNHRRIPTDREGGGCHSLKSGDLSLDPQQCQKAFFSLSSPNFVYPFFPSLRGLMKSIVMMYLKAFSRCPCPSSINVNTVLFPTL